MPAPLRPATEAEVVAIVAEAAGAGKQLAIASGGTKAGIGRPISQATPLAMVGLAGIVDYDPAELVLTLRPGTPLREVQTLVSTQDQMLAFEPFDHGPLFGEDEGQATIGGVVAAGVAGSQRVTCGGARDHLLGFRAVSGRGELFVAGAKVVKNVTGYDLPKLAAGSWGRLFAMTELTLKVMPRPKHRLTLSASGFSARAAVKAMSLAMGSACEVAAAAHLPRGIDGGLALTLFRLQGFEQSVASRAAALRRLLGDQAALAPLGDDGPCWQALRTLAPLAMRTPLWRINCPPSQAAVLIDQLGVGDEDWLMDWAGGLVWAVCSLQPDRVRAVAAQAGGHAMLVKAGPGLTDVPAFHPLPKPVADLETRLRRAFDPQAVFETGRF